MTFTRMSFPYILKTSDMPGNARNSCFPIVPKLACHHLGLPFDKPPRPITLLGGLTSFGGAGNNYSMHVSSSLNNSTIE